MREGGRVEAQVVVQQTGEQARDEGIAGAGSVDGLDAEAGHGALAVRREIRAAFRPARDHQQAQAVVPQGAGAAGRVRLPAEEGEFLFADLDQFGVRPAGQDPGAGGFLAGPERRPQVGIVGDERAACARVFERGQRGAAARSPISEIEP